MIGRTISHYRIRGKLGVGGMGVVYEATDRQSNRCCALKFLPPELVGDPDSERRLQREAATLSALNHPNICNVYEIGECGGRHFIAMERLEGVTLNTQLVQTILTTDELVRIAGQIAAALHAAHTRGIVHRDIKPNNVMVSSRGAVKVFDFGLARRFFLPRTGEFVSVGSTIPGRPMGTANYMAPERILQLPFDPRSDLFSLGAVLYEMATGQPPFAGSSIGATVENILEREPMPLRRRAPERPEALERVVHRLLAKRSANRYQSAAALIHDLESIAGPQTSPAKRRLPARGVSRRDPERRTETGSTANGGNSSQ